MIVKCPVCENELATNVPGRLTRDIEARLSIIRQEARRAAFKEAIARAARVIKLNNPVETAGAVAVCAALELDLAALEAAEKGERDG